MTEQDPGGLFEDLDRVQLEPYLQRTTEQAQQIEELLKVAEIDGGEVTCMLAAEQAEELLNIMNQECPYNKKSVRVFGRLTEAYLKNMPDGGAANDGNSGQFGLEDVIVEGKSLVSFGYAIMNVRTGQNDKPVRSVGNLFLLEVLPPCNDTPSLVDYIPRTFGFAPIGTLDVKYEREEASNIEFLYNNIPEIMADLDKRLSEAPDDCSRLLSLAECAIQKEQDMTDDVLMGLVGYVKGRLQLDPALPYILKSAGVSYSTTNQKIKYLLYEDAPTNQPLITCLIKPSINRCPEVNGKNLQLTTDAYWCIDVAVLGKDPQAEVTFMTVPVRNIIKLQSVRSLLYAS